MLFVLMLLGICSSQAGCEVSVEVIARQFVIVETN